MKSLYESIIRVGTKLQDVVLLLIRLAWGYGFYQAGAGKIANIETTKVNFGKLTLFGTDMGLPGGAAVNTYLAAYAEYGLGLALVVGVASRLVAIPLAFTMLVAYATAHWADFTVIPANVDGPWNQLLWSFGQFTSAGPFPFLVACLVIIVYGPGMFSVDQLLAGVVSKPASGE